MAGVLGRAWRWFVGLRPQRLFDVLWFVAALVVTLAIASPLARAVAISGEVPPWLLRDWAMAYVLGSYAVCSVAAAWYFRKMRRLLRARDAAVGSAIVWALSPAYFVIVVGIAACMLICEIGRRSRLLFDRDFAARYRNFVECRLARREGFIRERAGPGDRRWSEPELD